MQSVPDFDGNRRRRLPLIIPHRRFQHRVDVDSTASTHRMGVVVQQLLDALDVAEFHQPINTQPLCALIALSTTNDIEYKGMATRPRSAETTFSFKETLGTES